MANEEWRDFELLIARIEQWLGPQGAQVRSPDRINDRVTGQPREVDASIRFHAGSAPILVTVECRDRATVQDVTWIEQVAAKRNSVGAAKTIAVSSSGFSQPARIKAESLGIELRDIRNITEEVVIEWARNLTISLVSISWNPVSVKLIQADAASESLAEGGLPPEIASAFSADPLNTKLGYERSTGNPLTLQSIVELAISKLPQFAIDLPESGESIRKNITIDFPAKAFAMYTERGERDLGKMEVAVDARGIRQPIPLNVIRYQSDTATIIELAQADIEMPSGNKVSLLVSPTAPADNFAAGAR